MQVCLSTLVTLHNNYIKSKEEKNVVTRYSMLREMIKVCWAMYRVTHLVGENLPVT